VNQAVALLAPSSAAVHDLLQHRLQHALRQRVRYRYVKPNVLLEGRLLPDSKPVLLAPH
jgi:hypothetical protein